MTIDEFALTCLECGDVLDPADVVKCSCGRVLCENCYVEHGHIDHDTTEENEWMREGQNED